MTTDARATGFFKGDAIEFTGVVKMAHGGEWREFRYVDGPKAGQLGMMPTEAQQAKNVTGRVAEHQVEQAGFRRLAQAVQDATTAAASLSRASDLLESAAARHAASQARTLVMRAEYRGRYGREFTR